MSGRPFTETSRRYQTPSACRRRVSRAYGAMGRKADREEARCGWLFTMFAGRAYERWARARAHALLCSTYQEPA